MSQNVNYWTKADSCSNSDFLVKKVTFALGKSDFYLYFVYFFFVPNTLNRGRQEEKKVLYASQCASSRR